MLPSHERGFSLLEVVVTLGIFCLLIGAVVIFFLTGLRARTIIYNTLSAEGEARRAILTFLNEARSSTYSSIGAYPVESASVTQVVFFTNIDNDTSRERVRYYIAGTSLVRGTIKPSGNPLTYNPANESTSTIVHNVANTSTPVFAYYDQNYTGVEAPLVPPVNIGQIRMIGITLVINPDPLQTSTIFTVQDKAAVRNLKSN